MQIASAAHAEELTAARTAKGKVRTLLTGLENTPGNFVLRYSTGEEGEAWTTPRHRHPFDQVRYVLEGEYSIGEGIVLPTGWIGYFPESVYYGPQEMSPNLAMVVLQAGGPNGRGFYSADQRLKATAALKAAGGSFSNGVYSWTDADGKARSTPAGDVVWENVFGPTELLPARYNDIILMDPTSFAWLPDPTRPGVARKLLGAFTERDLRIGLVRLAAGAEYRLGGGEAPEIHFLTSGDVTHDGVQHDRLTAFATDVDEAPSVLRATSDAEFLYLKLPTF
jgi:hypothetical protein